MVEGLGDPAGEMLAVWRKWLAFSGCDDRGWHPDPHRWGALTVSQRNCLVDAELLECFLLPALSVDKLSLRRPGDPDPEVKAVLSPGRRRHDRTDFSSIGLLVERVGDFLERYETPGASPDDASFDFSAGSYIEPADPDAGERSAFPPVVDSYTFSISVCLQVKLLLQQWDEAAGGLSPIEDRLNEHVADQRSKAVDLVRLKALADSRLLAAMEGLAGCFVAVELGDVAWEGTGRTWEENAILTGLRERLRRQFPDLRGEGNPFELGFSWGHVAQEGDPDGWYADSMPYLYYTLSAIDGIVDLVSPSVRAVLTPQQSVAASQLGTYYEWCLTYWRTIAQGAGQSQRTRAVEDVPWRTSDNSSSLYYTLYLARLVAEGATRDQEELLDRLVRVVEELGHRSRLTRPATKPELGPNDRQLSLARRLVKDGNADQAIKLLAGDDGEFRSALDALKLVEESSEYDDPALLLHAEGLKIPLRFDAARAGDSGAWTGVYTIRDFTPQFMKLAARIHQRVPDKRSRERLRIAIDGAWAQLLVSRDGDSRNGYAWGDVDRLIGIDSPVPEDAGSHVVRSWRYTERVIEALIAVHEAEQTRRPSVPEVEAVLSGVLEELRWQINGIPDAAARNELRQRLADIEATLTSLGDAGEKRTRAEALAASLALAGEAAKHGA